MKVLFGVSSFGKISKAEILLEDFVLFVGQNNSGKTYMMQLIYGTLKALYNARFPALENVTFEEGVVELEEEWIRLFEKEANIYLQANKEKIVFDIFHRDIKIDELYVKFVDIDVTYRIMYKKHQYAISIKDEEDAIPRIRYRLTISERCAEEQKYRVIGSFGFMAGYNKKQIIPIFIQQIQGILLGMRNRESMLFFPASRTGLLLLYKYFFSEKDQMLVHEWNTGYNNEKHGNELGLSTPVYDFLQFLLRHTTSAAAMKHNQELLEFIEEYLLDGSLIQDGDDTFYTPNASKERIPLYLSSSLINEVAPIVKALSGSRNYQYLFYDEIETCMHPLKQGEMARLLIRLANSGRKMIVSTHSDTMALRLNNLFLLSREKDKGKLEKLGLSEADILNSKGVGIYQFKNMQDGTSLVEEIKIREVPWTGYDFELFSKNLDELYKECAIVME